MKLQQLFPSVLLASAVSVQIAAPAVAQVVQVTNVRVESTPSGLQLILQTDTGAAPQVSTSSDGKTFFADIQNAQLRLDNGEEFSQNNPVEGIASVTVTQREGDIIRVTVTGTRAVPTGNVTSTPQGLALSLTAPAVTAETPPERKPEDREAIEILVIREQQRTYVTPNATTGTRIDTPLRDVPQSVQVVPPQVIRDQQVVRVDEAVRNVSGVTFGGNSEGRGVEFSLRGFDEVPILRDGFRVYGLGENFLGIPEGFTETANLERVEVLKGPASILYGEVQPGGVINLVSKQPLPTPLYEGQFQVGNRGFIRPSLDISGPLNADRSLLYRLNTVYQRGESFRDFNTDIEKFFIAPVVSWKVSDRTDVSLRLEYAHSEQPADNGLIAFGNRVIDIPYDRITNEPNDFVRQEYLNIGYNVEHRFSDNWKLRNAFRYIRTDLETELALIFSADSFNEQTGIITRNLARQEIPTENYSLQTNVVGEFATGSIGHTLLFGVDLNRSELGVKSAVDFTGQDLDIFNPVYEAFTRIDLKNETPFQDRITETNRLGIYVQDQVALLDNLKVLVGLRYDVVDQNLTDFPNAFSEEGSETSQNNDAFSPRVGIVYQPIKEVSLYASYSRAFTPNSATTTNGDFIEPESSQGYEVGVKAELVRGRLSTTLSYFDITKQNVATADPNDPFSSVATGEQKSRGVELDVVGEILPGWNIIASYAYIDAEVSQDNTIPVGNQLAGIPRNSASLWTTYTIQKGDLQGLGFGFGFNYAQSRVGDLENTFDLPSHFVTNAGIFYRRDNWQVAFNVKNLFNVDYIDGIPNTRVAGISPGEPLTVIGSVSIRF
ncbi:TonB-dependent siderophore receptor [Argonema antarcticum]|uniref:TonB-dependent siderophore receptor n=1 Tax=Argonema antarcticum TaxID=2942763 RepID=UPI002011CE60|nr:TonB-dependent siderophore receptor [Argonema antarcticum]MCL1472552.1 TonB-dependent siderophore receptor [Argonema antarcticum A004/B2]